MTYRVGVDIGGSFTDFAVLDERTRKISSLKVFSRPDHPGAEVMDGIATIAQRYGIAASEITYFTLGTTVGVNTVIQRKGLRLALLTTRNFRDVLELARLRQPDMYNLLSKRPVPLISRSMVFEVDERIGADGAIVTALVEASVAQAVAQAQAAGAQGLVISLLHAYRNPQHERMVKEIAVRLAPDLPVVCSHEVWPIIREYERTITATISAYVQPRVAHYLTSLQEALRSNGVLAEAHVTKSNGGVMTAERGKTDCVQMILSGTASGVIGASHIAQLCGLPECMSLDVGGTSADVAIISNGTPRYGVGEYIGEFQIFIPSVSVTSIGDGGGSIAWVDSFGVIQVGPESAGSTPGPACFGRGGTRPTITDAFVACGLIGHEAFGYGSVQIDAEKARTSIATIATAVNKNIPETAESIIRVAISGMYSRIAGLTTRFAVDPRSTTLLAFGGAGPMLGCFLARELEIPEVVVPAVPGVLSALGGLIADLKNDFIQTVYIDLSVDVTPTLAATFRELERAAVQWLRDEQKHAGTYELIRSADMRYRGQSFELETMLDGDLAASLDADTLAEAFHRTHEQIYGHCDRKAAIQIINLRLVIKAVTPKPDLPRYPLQPGEASTKRTVEAWIDGAYRRVLVFARQALRAGHHFSGPAVVTQEDCTTCVPPGYSVRVDEFGNLRIKRGSAT